MASWDASTPTWCAGSARSTDGYREKDSPAANCSRSPQGIPACSRTGSGCPPPGDQDDKSRMKRDLHVRILWEPRGEIPRGYPTPEVFTLHQRPCSHLAMTVWLRPPGARRDAQDPGRPRLLSRQLAAEACPYANICEQSDNYVTAPEFI